jgi:2-polyprenyl-3-methyl-5-hydroxy-6-metoxy-1,4-benzoquinol methylase
MIDEILDRIGKSVPTQKKKIEKFFVECPDAKVELAEFLKKYEPFMVKECISIDIVVDSYLELVNQMLHSRLEFVRTGCYPSQSQKIAQNAVYSHKSTMQQYMLGLALSYFLWQHQFKLLRFYRESIRHVGPCKQFMEVGCGHGLLLVELLNHSSTSSCIDVIDISQQSIDMTKRLLETSFLNNRNCKFFNCDVFDFQTDQRYDFITVGEVLEHVDKPLDLLSKLGALLAPDGQIFISTCANCPAIDHVYHFKNVQEIIDIIAKAGLIVESEIVAPSEKKDIQYLEKNKVDISYAAILKREVCE